MGKTDGRAAFSVFREETIAAWVFVSLYPFAKVLPVIFLVAPRWLLTATRAPLFRNWIVSPQTRKLAY